MSKIKKINNDDVYVNLTKYFKRHPADYIRNHCGWYIWAKQKEIANAMVRNERVAVPASFGCGKTYIAARIAIWFLMNHRNSVVVTTAPTARQVRDLFWAEVRNANNTSKRILTPTRPLTTTWRIDDKWYMIGFSTKDGDVDKFTGYHSDHLLLVFDQACGIAPNVWFAGEGLMTSSHVRWLAISNTTDSQSEFANICLPDRKSEYGDWKVIKIKAADTPNVASGSNLIPGLINAKWLENKRKIWSYLDPMWQIFVEANFVEASAMVVLSETMRKEVFEEKIEPDFENIEIGIDVADEGIDRTSWFVRAGGRLLFIEYVNGYSPTRVVKKTQEIWKKIIKLTDHQPVSIKCDKIGVGSGVHSRLEELGYPSIGVNVGQGAILDKEKFLNLRAELSWTFREMVEARKVSFDPYYSTEDHIIQDLKGEMGIRYKLTSQGKIQIESKDDFKARIKRSPDIWDSAVLAYTNGGQDFHIEYLEVDEKDKEKMTIEQQVEDELEDDIWQEDYF